MIDQNTINKELDALAKYAVTEDEFESIIKEVQKASYQNIKIDYSEDMGILDLKAKIVKSFDYATASKIERNEEKIKQLGIDGDRIKDEYRARLKQIEADKSLSEKGKYEKYKVLEADALAKLKDISEQQYQLEKDSYESEQKTAKSIMSKLEESKPSDLSSSDYSYIDLMLKQGADLKDIASKMNYHPSVLDILNIGKAPREIIHHPVERMLLVSQPPQKDETGYRSDSYPMYTLPYSLALPTLYKKVVYGSKYTGDSDSLSSTSIL